MEADLQPLELVSIDITPNECPLTSPLTIHLEFDKSLPAGCTFGVKLILDVAVVCEIVFIVYIFVEKARDCSSFKW